MNIAAPTTRTMRSGIHIPSATRVLRPGSGALAGTPLGGSTEEDASGAPVVCVVAASLVVLLEADVVAALLLDGDVRIGCKVTVVVSIVVTSVLVPEVVPLSVGVVVISGTGKSVTDPFVVVLAVVMVAAVVIAVSLPVALAVDAGGVVTISEWFVSPVPLLAGVMMVSAVVLGWRAGVAVPLLDAVVSFSPIRLGEGEVEEELAAVTPAPLDGRAVDIPLALGPTFVSLGRSEI